MKSTGGFCSFTTIICVSIPLSIPCFYFLYGTASPLLTRSQRGSAGHTGHQCPTNSPLEEYEDDLLPLTKSNAHLDAFVASAKKYFISYGDRKYREESSRIKKEATESKFFDSVRVFSRDDISKEFMAEFQDTLSRKRGGGYWLWKFFFIKKSLEAIETGDFLVYIDADCHVNSGGRDRFHALLKLANVSKQGMVAYHTQGQERVWTSDKIFALMGLSDNQAFMNSKQLVGGIQVLQKRDSVMRMLNLSLSLLRADQRVITDDYNEETKRPEFRENRHDQSVFSVVKKCVGVVVVEVDPNL